MAIHVSQGNDNTLDKMQERTQHGTIAKDHLAAHSSFKIYLSGEYTLPTYPITGTSGQWNKSFTGTPIVIPHNLGFIPIVIAFIDFGGQYTLMPATFNQIESSTSWYTNHITVNADATNIYLSDITWTNGSVSDTSGGYSVKYYLGFEPAS